MVVWDHPLRNNIRHDWTVNRLTIRILPIKAIGRFNPQVCAIQFAPGHTGLALAPVHKAELQIRILCKTSCLLRHLGPIDKKSSLSSSTHGRTTWKQLHALIVRHNGCWFHVFGAAPFKLTSPRISIFKPRMPKGPQQPQIPSGKQTMDIENVWKWSIYNMTSPVESDAFPLRNDACSSISVSAWKCGPNSTKSHKSIMSHVWFLYSYIHVSSFIIIYHHLSSFIIIYHHLPMKQNGSSERCSMEPQKKTVGLHLPLPNLGDRVHQLALNFMSTGLEELRLRLKTHAAFRWVPSESKCSVVFCWQLGFTWLKWKKKWNVMKYMKITLALKDVAIFFQCCTWDTDLIVDPSCQAKPPPKLGSQLLQSFSGHNDTLVRGVEAFTHHLPRRSNTCNNFQVVPKWHKKVSYTQHISSFLLKLSKKKLAFFQ